MSSVVISVEKLIDVLKNEYDIIYADMIISQSQGMMDTKVEINNTKELVAAFDHAIEAGRIVGTLEGRVRSINKMLDYLRDEVKNHKKDDPDI